MSHSSKAIEIEDVEFSSGRVGARRFTPPVRRSRGLVLTRHEAYRIYLTALVRTSITPAGQPGCSSPCSNRSVSRRAKPPMKLRRRSCRKEAEHRILITQDLIYNDMRVFIAERGFDTWSAAFQHRQSQSYEKVLPGHGAPGGNELCDRTQELCCNGARTSLEGVGRR